MIEGLANHPFWLGVLGSTAAGACTAVGAAGVFAIQRLSPKLEDMLLSAAAGITALSILNTTDVHERINAMGAELRGLLVDVLLDEGVPWGIYGEFSEVHIFTNPEGEAIDPGAFDPFNYDYRQIKAARKELTNKLRLAMMNNGVDISGWPGGNISAAHTSAELERTADAFRTVVKALKQEGEIAS